MLGVGYANNDVTLNEMPGNHLGASIAIHRSGNAQTIKCVTLNEWGKQNQSPKVDFIKADIEGAERLLLDSARISCARINRNWPFADITSLMIPLYYLIKSARQIQNIQSCMENKAVHMAIIEI